MLISNIDTPIERGQTKGNPNAIVHYGIGLSAKQKRILSKLPVFDSRVIMRKSEVNMTDLSALTALTEDEYAMFTKGKERLIIRGNKNSVNINQEQAEMLASQGYKWSGHTHPGNGNFVLTASDGDREVLTAFRQSVSVIYDSSGKFQQFYPE
ncbi:MAG: hypothetical protein LBM87_02170 [Ruminococcus sp.]|jgi:hypothetical protein|nr:hypothetical protein [Ruminococcus sp.]